MSLRRVSALGLSLVLLTGCAAAPVLGTVTSLASAAKSGVSADLQIGDKQTQAEVVAQKTVTSSASKVKAKEATVDQSTKKEDKKTEIGAVQGDVKVVQGPSALTLLALAAGWPLFVIFLIVALYRKFK